MPVELDEGTNRQVLETIANLIAFAEAGAVHEAGAPVLARILSRASAWLSARPELSTPVGMLWTPADLGALESDLERWEQSDHLEASDRRMLMGFVQEATLERFDDEATRVLAEPLIKRAKTCLAR